MIIFEIEEVGRTVADVSYVVVNVRLCFFSYYDIVIIEEPDEQKYNFLANSSRCRVRKKVQSCLKVKIFDTLHAYK